MRQPGRIPQPGRKAIASPFPPSNRGRSAGPVRRSRGATAASGGTSPRARWYAPRARAEPRLSGDGARLAGRAERCRLKIRIKVARDEQADTRQTMRKGLNFLEYAVEWRKIAHQVR